MKAMVTAAMAVIRNTRPKYKMAIITPSAMMGKENVANLLHCGLGDAGEA